MGIELDFRKVETALESLERKAKSEVIHNSLRAGASVVEREIKKELRKNDHIDTHILINNIQETKLVKRGTSSWIRVGINPNAYNPYNPKKKGMRKEPRKVAIYGFILEHGTKWQAGTHWLSKARDNSFEESKEVIAKELKQRLGL